MCREKLNGMMHLKYRREVKMRLSAWIRGSAFQTWLLRVHCYLYNSGHNIKHIWSIPSWPLQPFSTTFFSGTQSWREIITIRVANQIPDTPKCDSILSRLCYLWAFACGAMVEFFGFSAFEKMVAFSRKISMNQSGLASRTLEHSTRSSKCREV